MLGCMLAHLSCAFAFALDGQQFPQLSCIAGAPLCPQPVSRWLLQTALQVAQGSHIRPDQHLEQVVAPHSFCSGQLSMSAKGRLQ